MKTALSVVTFFVPIVIVFVLSSHAIQPDTGPIDPQNPMYKEAVGVLLSSSQTLVTVALAIAAGHAIVIAHDRAVGPIFNGISGFICLIAVVVSVYFSGRIGYWGGLTLVAPLGEISNLLQQFNNQAAAVLIAGCALSATVVRQAQK